MAEGAGWLAGLGAAAVPRVSLSDSWVYVDEALESRKAVT